MRYIQYSISFNDILMYLVNPHFTSDYINEDVFNCIDSDKDGFISYDEWWIDLYEVYQLWYIRTNKANDQCIGYQWKWDTESGR